MHEDMPIATGVFQRSFHLKDEVFEQPPTLTKVLKIVMSKYIARVHNKHIQLFCYCMPNHIILYTLNH